MWAAAGSEASKVIQLSLMEIFPSDETSRIQAESRLVEEKFSSQGSFSFAAGAAAAPFPMAPASKQQSVAIQLQFQCDFIVSLLFGGRFWGLQYSLHRATNPLLVLGEIRVGFEIGKDGIIRFDARTLEYRVILNG